MAQSTSFSAQLARTKVLTFDCYGTLIDWAGGLTESFRSFLGHAVDRKRDEMFQAYVEIEAGLESGPYRDYREVLVLTLERMSARFGFPLPEDQRHALADALPYWTPFADTVDSLRRLRHRFRLGVLSNIDRDLFAGTARRLGVDFDFLICAQDVRSYKPSLGHFRMLNDTEGGFDHVLHVAQSVFHDGQPAKELGLAFVWINRYKETNTTTVRPLAEFPDLHSLADAASV